MFLNGQRIFEATGYRTDYTEQQLDPDALSAFVVGRNVLAVACRQTIGGQYVDAGLRTGTAEAVDADWRTRLQAAIDADPDSAAAHEARGIADRSARLLSSPVSEPYAALVVSERGGIAPGQRILLRGRAHAPGEPVEPDIPEVFRSTDAAARGLSLREPAPDAASTGRRLAFARWLVGGGAFLSARVAANRVWQSHFGRGLCRSPGDFGRLGSQPTHPELLDHLACELVARDWSLKALHRYLMSSQTYCMASTGDARSSAADPRNDLYWRFDPRRLSAEEFRDGVLATDGRLSGAFFGPGVYAPMPPEVLATASRPGQVWGRATGDDAVRRSVYVFVKRSLRLPLLESLDQPDPDLPCPERFPTNVPTQALITLNGEFVYESAGYFAARLEEKARSTEARVERGVALALGRPATRAEIGRHVAFVEDLCSKHGLDASEALRLFCLALYNGNEFLWVD